MSPHDPAISQRRPISDAFLAILHTLVVTAICLASAACGRSDGSAYQEVTDVDVQEPPQRILRLVWQDRDDATLKWGDLMKRDDAWSLQPQLVAGVPTFDARKQDLVQMGASKDVLLVGVRDHDGGTYQSGWVAIDHGVHEELHGDHSDWKYVADPRVLCSVLDSEQGNPAHLYVYDGHFFLANDQKNGFTRFAPDALQSTSAKGTFFPGGGNHITLAAADNTVGYSTWIDGDGSNRGRVDVVNLQATGEECLAYSFHLDSGGLHGATINSGRVFLAPADGICWLDVDRELKESPETVKVHHIALGKDEEKDRPLRTGAFENHRNWILFTTGRSDSSALCLLDAAALEPSVIKLPIKVADGLSLVAPKTVQAATGKRYAFVFQDRKAGEGDEFLTIIDLDPNADRNFSDAVVARTIPVGASRIEGHHGHHAIGFDAEGHYACLSNPGDGTIQILDLSDLTIVTTIPAGGTPSAILAIGTIESEH